MSPKTTDVSCCPNIYSLNTDETLDTSNSRSRTKQATNVSYQKRSLTCLPQRNLEGMKANTSTRVPAGNSKPGSYNHNSSLIPWVHRRTTLPLTHCLLPFIISPCPSFNVWLFVILIACTYPLTFPFGLILLLHQRISQATRFSISFSRIYISPVKHPS